MKKVFTILFLLIYSLSVFGIGLKEIYCCGKLKTIAVTVDDKYQCTKDNGHNGCCKIKYLYLKVKDSHLSTISTPLLAKPSTEIHLTTAVYRPVFYNFQPKALINGTHAPPLHNGIPIHIFNCVYRIWFLSILGLFSKFLPVINPWIKFFTQKL